MTDNEISTRLKILYLCDRVGPYHFASLNAANDYADIIVLEFSLQDDTYAWDIIEEPSKFRRITLFNEPILMQPAKAVNEKIRTVLEEIQPDVVALSGWEPPASLMTLRWCLKLKIPTIMMSDSQENDKPRIWLLEYLKSKIVKLATAGFAGGTPHVAYLKSLGLAEDKILTGGVVVDNDYFTRKARMVLENSTMLREQYNLPQHFFLASGRFIEEKNIFNLLTGYANYVKNAGASPWKLVLLGDGKLRSDILTLRSKLGLTEMVIMPGFIQYPDLPVYYGLASAFLLASISETWGLVVNEAMASGLPVIVSNRCGCASDLVIPGKNGFIFDPHDNNTLTKYLTYISGKECSAKSLGEESLRIIQGWGLDLFAKNLSKAAALAEKAPGKKIRYFDRVLLWLLINLRSKKVKTLNRN